PEYRGDGQRVGGGEPAVLADGISEPQSLDLGWDDAAASVHAAHEVRGGESAGDGARGDGGGAAVIKRIQECSLGGGARIPAASFFRRSGAIESIASVQLVYKPVTERRWTRGCLLLARFRLVLQN